MLTCKHEQSLQPSIAALLRNNPNTIYIDINICKRSSGGVAQMVERALSMRDLPDRHLHFFIVKNNYNNSRINIFS